jgi:hypothetical protein
VSDNSTAQAFLDRFLEVAQMVRKFPVCVEFRRFNTLLIKIQFGVYSEPIG